METTTKTVDRKKLTAMMRQYVEVKDKFPNDLVLFRVGDFFEAYFEDALPFSQICSLTLTCKRIGSGDNKAEKEKNLYTGTEDKFTTDEILNSKMLIPMAGIPHKVLNNYAQQLIDAGKRVVVVEQMEDPKNVKNRLVKREVVSILSSMDKDGEFLSEYVNNWVCSIYNEENIYGLCFTDVSTSDVYLTNVDSILGILNEISRFKPSEIVLNSKIAPVLSDLIEKNLKLKTMITIEDSLYEIEEFVDTLLRSFDVKDLDAFNYKTVKELKSLYIMIRYIDYTKKLDFSFSKMPILYTYENYMSVDMYSRKNLELVDSASNSGKKGTLLYVLDKCQTSMGRRLLDQWMKKPLQNRNSIEKRLDAVSELMMDKDLLKQIQDSLIGVLDISRIIGKLKMNKAVPKDIVNLRESLARIPKIKEYAGKFNSPMLSDLYNNMNTFDDLVFLLQKALLDDPVSDIKEGLVLKSGYNKDLDTARDMIENSNKYLQDLENKERQRTGIKNLKVVNKNGQCTIDVPNKKENLDKIPSDYRLEKPLKNSWRYLTDAVEKLDRELYSAIERSKSIEIDLYEELKSVILQEHTKLAILSDMISVFDVLCGLACVAINNNYVRPSINTDGIIDIKGGRHPIVEKVQNSFVKNDAFIDMTDNKFILITGPNMAGKSTYMRQIALISFMTHLGSFVPADSANIPIIDKIFTRIGASDDISSGQSTYMVEMREVKNILDCATGKSLVLLDEVGRGTSTSDGLSIAQAISEYIYNEIGCKVLFATHYHELVNLEKSLKGLKNYHLSTEKKDGNLIFTRKLIKGGTSESLGIDVAQLAGLPNSVIQRAWQILHEIEDVNKYRVEVEEKSENDAIIEQLREIDKSRLSPSMAYYLLCNLIDSIN